MIRKVLESIHGLEVYPVFSLIVFTVVFAGMLTIVARMRPAKITALSHLVFDDATHSHSGDEHDRKK